MVIAYTFAHEMGKEAEDGNALLAAIAEWHELASAKETTHG